MHPSYNMKPGRTEVLDVGKIVVNCNVKGSPRSCPHRDNRHTIILMQTSHNRATRTFMDYGSINSAMDGICALYERKLKEINPAVRDISYDIGDLYNFIDGLADMSALVYDHSIQAYLPYDREWIKHKAFQRLKKLAREPR